MCYLLLDWHGRANTLNLNKENPPSNSKVILTCLNIILRHKHPANLLFSFKK